MSSIPFRCGMKVVDDFRYRPPFEGAGHYRPFTRKKRERDFGKKRHAKSKQVKKSRARNRK